MTDIPQFTVSPDQEIVSDMTRFESPRVVRMCIPHITENVAEFIARHAKDGANICLESEMPSGAFGSAKTTIRAMYPCGTEVMETSGLGWTITWDTEPSVHPMLSRTKPKRRGRGGDGRRW